MKKLLIIGCYPEGSDWVRNDRYDEAWGMNDFYGMPAFKRFLPVARGYQIHSAPFQRAWAGNWKVEYTKHCQQAHVSQHVDGLKIPQVEFPYVRAKADGFTGDWFTSSVCYMFYDAYREEFDQITLIGINAMDEEHSRTLFAIVRWVDFLRDKGVRLIAPFYNQWIQTLPTLPIMPDVRLWYGTEAFSLRNLGLSQEDLNVTYDADCCC